MDQEMTDRKIILRRAFVAYSVAVVLSLAVCDRGLWGPARKPFLQTEIEWAPTQTRTISGPMGARLSVFRENSERTGFSAASLSPPLKQTWKTQPFNVGIHSASKASPAVDASGIFLG